MRTKVTNHIRSTVLKNNINGDMNFKLKCILSLNKDWKINPGKLVQKCPFDGKNIGRN